MRHLFLSRSQAESYINVIRPMFGSSQSGAVKTTPARGQFFLPAQSSAVMLRKPCISRSHAESRRSHRGVIQNLGLEGQHGGCHVQPAELTKHGSVGNHA